MTTVEDTITLDTKGKIAIITINLPQKLNALTRPHYDRIADLLRAIAVRDDIFITLLTGKGRYFSA